MRMARLAEPLMDRGGTLLTMSYLGAAEVVPNYGVMGPVKAALEASVRYLATELGPARHPRQRGVAGPDAHARRLRHPHFDELIDDARARRAPLRRGRDRRRRLAGAPSSSATPPQAITGDVHYVDGGFHILA